MTQFDIDYPSLFQFKQISYSSFQISMLKNKK